MAYNNYIQARVCIKVKKKKKKKKEPLLYTPEYQLFIFHYTLVYLVFDPWHRCFRVFCFVYVTVYCA